MKIHIPENHPRAASLRVREQVIEACQTGVVAYAGLIAHGRGEAFDYLIGEATPDTALQAVEAAAAALLLAVKPVLSVNGNLAALCPAAIVRLAEISGAAIEINLFYRTPAREKAIRQVLQEAGATRILGVDPARWQQIPELQSERRIVDSEGIFIADVVLVPLEDGDRTEALVKTGKKVITIDLNPLSRTARQAQITIVDEVSRAMALLIRYTAALKQKTRLQLQELLDRFDNHRNLAAAVRQIGSRLQWLAEEFDRAQSGKKTPVQEQGG